MLSRRVRRRPQPRPGGRLPGVVGGAGLPAGLGDRDAAGGPAAAGRDGELRLAHSVSDRRVPSAWSASTSGCGFDDTPAFEALSDSDEVAESPLKEAVTTAWRPDPSDDRSDDHPQRRLLRRVHLSANAISSRHYISPRPTLHLDHLASLVALALILPLGALSDRIGRRPLLIAGAAGFAVLAYPAFLLLNSGSLANAILAHCLPGRHRGGVRLGIAGGRHRVVRHPGPLQRLSVGYNVSVAVFGGTTPYVVTLLAARTGNDYAAGDLRGDRRGGVPADRADDAGDRRQTTGGTGR